MPEHARMPALAYDDEIGADLARELDNRVRGVATHCFRPKGYALSLGLLADLALEAIEIARHVRFFGAKLFRARRIVRHRLFDPEGVKLGSFLAREGHRVA